MLKKSFSILTISIVLAFTVLSVCFAFSQAIYSGILREYANIGTLMILAGSGINIIIISIFSDIPTAVARPQDEPLPLLLIMLQGLAIHFVSGSEGFLTIFIAMIFSTILTGIMLYIIGYFNLGNLIRFVPFPMIAGFLASAGLLLIINGVKQVLPVDLTGTNLEILLEYKHLLLWFPSITFGFILFILTFRSSSAILLQSIILAGFLAFYLIFFLSGQSIEWLQSSHLLLEIQPISFDKLLNFDFVVHWSFLFHNLYHIIIIAFISSMALLFILVSLDLALKLDINFNRELKIAGIANIFTGLFGGIIGYHGLANTLLVSKVAVKTRFIGIFCGCICIAAILFADVTLAYFPRFILSGLIIFLGISLFYHWTFMIWHQFDRFDIIVVLIVLSISTFLSFFFGIIAGFIISFIFFILTYSWVSPIRFIMPGNALSTIHQRPPIPSYILKKRGKEIIYVKLQNYLFFGSAYGVVMKIQKILNRKQKHPIQFIVYDFERVVGIDSSGEMIFKKIAQYAEQYNFKLIFTGLRNDPGNELYRRIQHLSITDSFTLIPTLEDAMNYCELKILEQENFDSEAHKYDAIKLEDYLGDKGFQDAITKYFSDVTLKKNEHLFHKNDLSNELFYLESGQLRIYMDLSNATRKNLAIIDAGNFIGELAFFLHAPRSASVYAEEDCVLKSIDQKSLKLMANDNPELYEKIYEAIVFLLAMKLSDTTKKLGILSL